MMETIINDGICRCCATEGSFKDLDTAYHWMGSEEVYADMLRDCFDISLSKPETYNNGGICEVCITQLRNASNFKKQVQLTEKQFLKKVEESTFRANIVKIEVPRLEVDNDDIFDGNVSDGFSSPEYDVPLTKIKIEKESEKPKKRSTKASTSKAKKLKGEDGEPSSKRKKRVITFQKPVAQRRMITVTTSPRIQVLTKKSFETDKHQENIKLVLLNSNATPINYKAGLIGYGCCFCAEQFGEPANLKNHTLQNHDDKIKSTFMKGCSLLSYIVRLDITGLKCILCNLETKELNELIKHLESGHNVKYHNDINNHIVPFRFDCASLYCVYCNENFNHFKGLAEHMNSHYRNYVCEVCDAGFVNKRTLRTHGYRHKTGVFNCSLCSKVFDTRVKKRDHEWGIHINPKRNKCIYCDERFSDYTKKKEHEVKMHGAKQIMLPCKACDKSFDSQRALRFHTKYYHLMQKKSGRDMDANDEFV